MSTIREPSTTGLTSEQLTALRASIQALPKVELHRHLEGSLRLSTLKFYYCTQTLGVDPAVVTEVFAARGTLGQRGTAVFLSPATAPTAVDGVTTVLGAAPASEAVAEANKAQRGVPEEAELTRTVIDRCCCYTPEPDLVSFLAKFGNIQNVFQTPTILEQLAFEVVEDCALVNTKILELRYSPSYVAGGHGLSFEAIHAAFLAGVKRAQEKYEIAVGLVGIMERQMSIEEVTKVCDFVIANKDTFVGIDLANDELNNNADRFQGVFQKAYDAGIKITVHSGEVPVDEAPQWVWESITNLHALRIGHGFQIIRNPATMAKAAAAGTVFEVCPSSNYLCQGVDTVASHPLRKLVEGGLTCTINTDDPGMFGVDMNNEIEIAVTVLGLTMEQVQQMLLNARKGSFVSEEEKAKYWPLK